MAAAIADVGQEAPPGAVILSYHQVKGRTSRSVDMPVWLFERQMEALSASGRVVSLDRAVDLLEAPPQDQPHQSAVVLTFDDGSIDFIEQALPVLEHFRLPVTLYLATAWTEQGVPFWEGDRPLSWGALREAVSTGLVSVQSHSHSHLLFDRESPAMLAQDLDRSIGLIEDNLGVEVRHFAYPKALPPSAAVEDEVRRRFRTAALDGTRVNPYHSTDLHRLFRSPIQRNDGMRWFRRKVAGGMGAEDGLRHLLFGVRYAGAQR